MFRSLQAESELCKGGFVQDTKRAVSTIKQATDVGNKYIFDMWSHISDVDNHMAM